MSPGRRGGSDPARKDAGGPGPVGGDGGKTRTYRQLGDLLSVGWNFAVSIGVGLGLGIGFDRWLGTRPWGTIGFLLLGIVSGFVSLFRIALRLDKGDDRGKGAGEEKGG